MKQRTLGAAGKGRDFYLSVAWVLDCSLSSRRVRRVSLRSMRLDHLFGTVASVRD